MSRVAGGPAFRLRCWGGCARRARPPPPARFRRLLALSRQPRRERRLRLRGAARHSGMERLTGILSGRWRRLSCSTTRCSLAHAGGGFTVPSVPVCSGLFWSVLEQTELRTGNGGHHAPVPSVPNDFSMGNRRNGNRRNGVIFPPHSAAQNHLFRPYRRYPPRDRERTELTQL